MGNEEVVEQCKHPVHTLLLELEEQGGEAAEISSRLMTEWGLLAHCQGALPCAIAQCLLLEQASLRQLGCCSLVDTVSDIKQKDLSLILTSRKLKPTLWPLLPHFCFKLNLSSNFSAFIFSID